MRAGATGAAGAAGATGAAGARRARQLALAALALSLPWAGTGCVLSGSYGGVARYPSPAPEPERAPELALLSAHLSAYGEPPPPLEQTTEARMLEGSERQLDRLVLVFREQLDASSVDPRAFAIARGDGRRVRPVRAVLAPADEGDENRSLTLFGNFGSAETPPVAVHVIGSLRAESGADLRGLDADISGPEQPDRVVLVERLDAQPGRCPGAQQVVRAYWSDRLGPSEAALLEQIELRFADGTKAAPVELDDQRMHELEQGRPGEVPAVLLGREDDNVLDLCVAQQAAVIHLHVAAGALRDAGGTPSAAVDVELPPAALPRSASAPEPASSL